LHWKVTVGEFCQIGRAKAWRHKREDWPNFDKKLVVFGLTAQAQIFTGLIDFRGNATLNAPLGSATAFTSISAFVSGGQTGDLFSVPNYTPRYLRHSRLARRRWQVFLS